LTDVNLKFKGNQFHHTGLPPWSYNM